MTISPHTMDVLYRNGTIDYVPYELMVANPVPHAQQPQVSAQTLSYPQDSFTSTNQLSPSVAMNALGMGADYNAQATEVSDYRKSLKDGSENDAKVNKKTIVKGLVSASILVGTLVLLIKGIKTPKFITNAKDFFAKLNPAKWFKK